MKAKLTAFIDGLILYDYTLFGAVFGLFILFIILSIVLRRKVVFAIFLVLLAFTLLIAGPTVGYIKMHEYLFKNTTTLVSQKKLEFVNAVVVKGSLKNESNRNFSSCKITAKIHKVSKNSFKNYIYQFKTLKKGSIIRESISKGEAIDFKIIVEPFKYSKDYNISLGAKCK